MSDEPISIRHGTAGDYPRAAAVIAATFAFHRRAAPEFFAETDAPPPSCAAIEDLLRDGDGMWLLAWDGEVVVGFVTIRLRSGPYEPSQTPETRAIVDSLGILPAYRRRGIGRRLMDAAERWAREQGAARAVLNVWEFNIGALALYEDLGYAAYSRNLWKPL